ncbi:sulfonate ABC transporter permease [Lysinibacillus sp. 2017]|uniref:ABC transporter permease n=1 Tax=unclassified Lysinibacillus TaxID=2636778 RepID=UPI000D529394|nr:MULTISPECIES: ABC transporter permease [unclassified Lysinibacillus]AWE08219.1 sulfonate ABC transporter permease [Lysinibacillus sp. 2017]TGN36278.1 ABC transporter permease [Lysinibacillus sp. S2017]
MVILKKLSPIAIGFILLIVIWQFAIVIGGYQAALFPPPLKVGETLVAIISDGSLFTHIQISLFRFLSGYLVAVIVAVLLGLIVGRLPIMWKVLDPVVQVLRPVSPIAWSPFIVLWFGIGNMPAIVIIFIAAFFPVLLSTVTAVKKVDKTYLRIASNFEMSPFETLRKIILPASFPMIANGLHMALGAAWIFLVAGEMVGTQSGLGFLIVDARNSLSLDLVMACIVVIGVIGLVLDKGIHYFERYVNRIWGGSK